MQAAYAQFNSNSSIFGCVGTSENMIFGTVQTTERTNGGELYTAHRLFIAHAAEYGQKANERGEIMKCSKHNHMRYQWCLVCGRLITLVYGCLFATFDVYGPFVWQCRVCYSHLDGWLLLLLLLVLLLLLFFAMVNAICKQCALSFSC